jgi:1,4-dihydroxy-2-naphthoyl-CoA hydrolase
VSDDFRDQIPLGELAEQMGVTFQAARPGYVEATMPVAGNRQPYGLLHGGASAVLAETVGSVAAALHAGLERIAVGIELSCTHHKSARDGFVRAIALPLHEGGSIATYDIKVTDENDALICTARLTCAIRKIPTHAT